MKLITLILAAITGAIDIIKRWFDRADKKQKDKEDAAQNASDNIFLCLMACILLFAGCNNVRLGDTPITFDPCDYQPLKAGQSFKAPKDGVYFSKTAASKWTKAKIFEYELNKNGFNKEEKKK